MNRPNFNHIARAYRWMEYFSFGHRLEACRFAQLNRLNRRGDPKHALILGDGDGRFLERLLKQYPQLTADVIDLSPAMIALAAQRTKDESRRVGFHVADIRTFQFAATVSYDLVAAHFFLDCLSEPEFIQLLHRVKPHLTQQAAFILSEFAVPAHEPFRSVARLLIRSLYIAFRALTGLTTHSIPDYPSILGKAGFICEEAIPTLGGILRSERWRRADGGNEALHF